MGTRTVTESVFPRAGVRLTSLTAVAALAAGTSIVAIGGSEASATTDDTTSPTAFTVELPQAISADSRVAARSLDDAEAPAVTVYAWPSVDFDKGLKEGDSFELFEVDADTVAADGGLAVNIAPDSIRQTT